MANKQTETKEKNRFSLLETELIKDLYKEVIHTKNKNEVGLFEISLGEFDEPEDQKRINGLEQLKKKGIVKNYSIEEIEKIFKNPPSESGYDDAIIAIAKCELMPIKIVEAFEYLCKAEKAYCEELSSLVLRLIDIINLFFNKKTNIDEKVKLNKFYKETEDAINDILKESLISYLKNTYKKPFRDLFYALKELTTITLRKQNEQLQFYYYTIQDFIELHKNLLKEPSEKLLITMEEYIKNLKERTENIPIKIEGLENKTILRKGKNIKILTNFPCGINWQDITIRFLNNHEVIINAKDFTMHTNYEEMGFKDEKKKNPNKQWDFLKLLSTKNQALSWENNYNLSTEIINRVKKQKQLLSESLKTYFQIEDDPFFDYKKEKAYRIKINLIPENISEEEQY